MEFLESIRFENGHYHLLSLHQLRVNKTFAALYPGIRPVQLDKVLPIINEPGKFKIRVIYNHTDYHVEHAPYQAKIIRSVKLVEANDLEYAFKYSDRTEINKLVENSGADEIIIVKNGFITDTSYANIACFDGMNWWTPERPLLEGVRRQSLLDDRQLFTKVIKSDDLSNYTKVCLINSMLDLEELNLDISIVR